MVANRFMVLVGLALLAPAAAADRLPFSRAELDEALRMRVPAGHQVEVTPAADGITVTVDGRSRSVVLGDEQGTAAARVVALVAAALAVDGTAAAGGAGGTVGGAAGVMRGGGHGARIDAGSAVLPAARPAVRLPGRWHVALRADEPLGERSAGGFGAVVAREGAGRLRAGLAVGYDMRSLAVAVDGGDVVSMHSVPLRAGASLTLDRRGWFAVSASVVAAPFLTRGGRGDRGVLLGGGPALRGLLPLLSADTDVLLEAGVDVMANQIEYRWDDRAALTTGRVRPWITLGVSWERRR